MSIWNNWNRLRPGNKLHMKYTAETHTRRDGELVVMEGLLILLMSFRITHTIQIRKFYLKLFEMAHCKIKRRHRKRKSIHIKKQYNFRLCSVFSFGSRLYGYFCFFIEIRMHVMCLDAENCHEIVTWPLLFSTSSIGLCRHFYAWYDSIEQFR